jgi:hypothetical protein
MKMKLREVASTVNLSNHATIIHACTVVRNGYYSDRSYRDKIDRIFDELNINRQEACIRLELTVKETR